MSKKSLIIKEKKKNQICIKNIDKIILYNLKKKSSKTLKEYIYYSSLMDKLPKNSFSTRLRNRCKISGRSRGYIRDFGISRHKFRDLIGRKEIPGVLEHSW